MRTASSFTMACLLLLAGSGALSDGANAAEALPDLYLAPEDIAFHLYDERTESCYRGQLVVVEVTVHNAGPGNSSAASLSIYDGGTLLAELLAGQSMDGTGPYNYSVREYVWNTSALPEGEHEIRVEASDPAGDAHPADNVAVTSFTLVPPPELSIDLVQTSQSPPYASSISAQFRGEVRLDGCGNLTVQVGLSSRIDRYWSCNIDHTWLTFDGPGTRAFNISAQSYSSNPAGLPRLTVEAVASGEGYHASASISVNVSFAPRISVGLECDVPYKEVPPGGTVKYTISVVNRGSTTDSFDVEIQNREELEALGWNLTLNRTRVADLPPNGHGNITLTARVPEEWTLWKSAPVAVSLNGRSTSNGSFRQSFPIFIYVKGGNPVLAGALLAVLIAVVASLAVAGWVLGKRARRRRQASAAEAPPEEGVLGLPLKELGRK